MPDLRAPGSTEDRVTGCAFGIFSSVDGDERFAWDFKQWYPPMNGIFWQGLNDLRSVAGARDSCAGYPGGQGLGASPDP